MSFRDIGLILNKTSEDKKTERLKEQKIYFHFVALRINSAISSGCNTSDVWLELSDRVVASIRSAN